MSSQRDFLPKFLSLHYYTTLEVVFGVQRSGQAQETMICCLVSCFSTNMEWHSKNLQKLSKSTEKLLFLGYFQSLFNFSWKTAQTN
jgi:hypothetical protein